jgi:imidazolonepropionase-like amidohydrolase
MNRMHRRDRTFLGSTLALVALGAGALLYPMGGALAAQTPAPPQSGPIALTGGTLHTISGASIAGGTLVFENGVITALGVGVAIPEGAQRIDITGHHVYPGLIDGWSQMGLYEIGGIDVAIDLNELGDLNPNVRAAVAFHPESRHIGTTRSSGILVAVSSPSGGLISGLASAMMLDGWSWESMTLKAETGLVVNWPTGNNANMVNAAIRTLSEAVASARAYGAAREAAGNDPTFPVDARWEAMLPVLAGEIPVLVQANTVRAMQDAITWAEAEGLRPVIVGGLDAGYIADYLAAKQVPVLLSTVLRRPSRDWEPVDHLHDVPLRLHEAGALWGIVGGSSAPYANRLPYEAGITMAQGLPEIEALRALTLYPARYLGIEDRVGSLEVGKDATLLITTGNPLEYATTIEQAFIQGRDLDLNDVHRQFFERYSEKLRQQAGPSEP